MLIDKKANKVAIVGCSGTKNHVRRLYNDLDKFEIWGLNQLYIVFPEIVPKATRWFQIHHEDRFLEGDHNTFEWMKQKHPFPIYVREEYVDQFPSAVAFPEKEIIRKFGRYFSSQIAWMMALAIHEKYEEIHLYGIHMVMDDEYHFQKEGIEYYIGLARGMGIKVFIPPGCELLKTAFLYGFEDPSPLLLKVQHDIKEYQSKLKLNNGLRQKNRDEMSKIQGNLLIMSDEEERSIAQKMLRELAVKDLEIRDQINQVIGYLESLRYFKENWIFRMGDMRYGRHSISSKGIQQDCDYSGDQGKADSG